MPWSITKLTTQEVGQYLQMAHKLHKVKPTLTQLMVDVKTVVVEGTQAAVIQKAYQAAQRPWIGLQLLQKEAA